MVDLYNWVDAEAMANHEARIAVDTFASGKMNDARLKVQVRCATARQWPPWAVRPGPQPAARDRTPPACCATSTAAHCCALLQQCGTCCRYRKG